MRGIRHLFALFALAVAAASASAEDLNFGIIATDTSVSLRERWQPFLDDMQKTTGLKINAFFAPDYAGVIEAMRFNKVQVAWFGNKSAIEAVDRANGEVFAQVVYADGTAGYKSVIITNVDSPIKSLDQLLKDGKSYSFGIGDPSSTSGFLVPSYYVFALNGRDPQTTFKVVRSANHGANLLAVLNKQVDAATNNTEELDKLKANDPKKLDQLRILWTSPTIPSDPFVWRRDISEDTKAKIKNFVVGYGKDEREKAIIKNIYNYGGFRASTNAQLIPVRQLELFKERKKTEADDSMSPTEKQAHLAELDAKLAALSKESAQQ